MIVGLLAVVLIICNGCKTKNESDPTTTSTPTSTPETPATSAPALTTTSTPALTTTSTNTVSGFLEVKERIDCPTMQLNTILMDNELIGLSWFDNRIEIFDFEKQVLKYTKESYEINQTITCGNNIYFYYYDYIKTEIPLIRYDKATRKFYEYSSEDLGFYIIDAIVYFDERRPRYRSF
jgi:hypothetical protein